MEVIVFFFTIVQTVFSSDLRQTGGQAVPQEL